MSIQVSDIKELTVAERLRIVEDIWETIVADASELEISEELRSELDRRLEAYHNDPGAGVSWEELNERLARSR